MKKCPKCGQIFDPDFDFCLEDGTRLKALLADSADIPTQEIKTPQTLRVPVNQTISATGGPAAVRKGAGAWVFGVIGVLALGLIAAVGIILLLWYRSSNPAVTTNTNSNTVTNANNTNRPATPMGATPTPKPSASNTPDDSSQLSGSWSGEWTDGGALFSARVDLTETNGKVEGKIFWTYVRASSDQKKSEGKTATEFVRGTFNETTHSVDISGYRKDDPDNIIILDHYRMTLSSDGRSLSGKTKSGTIQLHR